MNRPFALLRAQVIDESNEKTCKAYIISALQGMGTLLRIGLLLEINTIVY